MTAIYEPSRSIGAKISRRLTVYRARRDLKFKIDRPVVSFTFDDCPKSAITNGISLLENEGWHATIYIAGGLLDVENHHGKMMSIHDVRRLDRKGHEIGGHTFSHRDASSTELNRFLSDVERNQKFLKTNGIRPGKSFAYPFGEVSPALKTALSKNFIGLRGIRSGIHKGVVDRNQIRSYPVFSSKGMDDVIEAINNLKKNRSSWLTLFTHDVRQTPSDWGCTPEEMKTLISAVKKSGAMVLPISNAIEYLKDHEL